MDPFDDCKLWASAQDSAKKKIISQLFECQLRFQLDAGACADTKLQTLFDSVSSIAKKNRFHDGYWWITINFDSKLVTNEQCIEKIEKISQWKWIKHLVYTFEQRSEDIEHAGQGMHVHMLLACNAPREFRDIRSDFVKTLTGKIKYIGNTSSNILNIKKIPDKYYGDKIDYIKGEKWDDDKSAKIQVDSYWRSEMNLEHFYEIGEKKKISISIKQCPTAETIENVPSDVETVDG